MAKYEIQTVTLSGGKEVPATLLICPRCQTLDLGVQVDTSEHPWHCICPKGHEFYVNALIN